MKHQNIEVETTKDRIKATVQIIKEEFPEMFEFMKSLSPQPNITPIGAMYPLNYPETFTVSVDNGVPYIPDMLDQNISEHVSFFGEHVQLHELEQIVTHIMGIVNVDYPVKITICKNQTEPQTNSETKKENN